MAVCLEKIEGGFDRVGKYGLGLGSVTGAVRMGVGAVAAVVSVVAIAVFALLGLCGCDFPEGLMDLFVFGWKHLAIGASELIPGVKWILEDSYGWNLRSNPSL